MKKLLITFLIVILSFSVVACGHNNKVTNTYQSTDDGVMQTYYEMSDGTWKCGEYTYKYRLEIKGRMNNAVSDTVFVYLSNEPEITFEQAWKAAGLSSLLDDYFSPEEAVCVELKTIY